MWLPQVGFEWGVGGRQRPVETQDPVTPGQDLGSILFTVRPWGSLKTRGMGLGVGDN